MLRVCHSKVVTCSVSPSSVHVSGFKSSIRNGNLHSKDACQLLVIDIHCTALATQQLCEGFTEILACHLFQYGGCCHVQILPLVRNAGLGQLAAKPVVRNELFDELQARIRETFNYVA
jgi:hypothetical protein